MNNETTSNLKCARCQEAVDELYRDELSGEFLCWQCDQINKDVNNK